MELIFNRTLLRFGLQARYGRIRVGVSDSISLPGARPLLGLLQRIGRTRPISILDVVPWRSHARWIGLECEY